MSVAQVEAANHFPNERPSRPKNGPPTAGDDGSSDRVHHHHHSNGATIADNNGRSASRYDTNATTPLDGYSSYQKRESLFDLNSGYFVSDFCRVSTYAQGRITALIGEWTPSTSHLNRQPR